MDSSSVVATRPVFRAWHELRCLLSSMRRPSPRAIGRADRSAARVRQRLAWRIGQGGGRVEPWRRGLAAEAAPIGLQATKPACAGWDRSTVSAYRGSLKLYPGPSLRREASRPAGPSRGFSRRAVLEDAALRREGDGLGAGAGAEFVEDRGDVEAGGALGDGEAAADLLVGEALGDEAQDFAPRGLSRSPRRGAFTSARTRAPRRAAPGASRRRGRCGCRARSPRSAPL